MNFEEHAAKPLLAGAGIAIPQGRLARTPGEAEQAAASLGPVMVKAQVPAGKRGKAGGIKPADTPDQARQAAEHCAESKRAAKWLGHDKDGNLIYRCE